MDQSRSPPSPRRPIVDGRLTLAAIPLGRVVGIPVTPIVSRRERGPPESPPAVRDSGPRVVAECPTGLREVVFAGPRPNAAVVAHPPLLPEPTVTVRQTAILVGV
ncbi:hypothetical protein KPB2_5519 [Klebsiella pneumoniae Kb677]|nr:hypothetical protein KPB2_5519 [Klebsiella pneumoniae Kb677]